MKYRTRLSRLVAASLLVGTSVHAAGYYSGHRGAAATGRAGAFAAKADDLSAVLYNPAGLAALGGTVVQAANRFSYATQSFTRAPTVDFGQVGNPTYVFPAATSSGFQALDPLLGVGTNFGLKDWGFALVAYAPPGTAKATYPLAGGTRYMMVSREATMLNYALSAAHRFSDMFGVGVSLQATVVPSLEYNLVADANPSATQSHPVSSPLDILATVKVSDYFTPNAIVGAWLAPVDFLQIGASAQVIPTSIRGKGSLGVTPISPPTGAEPPRLFSLDPVLGEQPPKQVELELPLPIIARAGVRYVHRQGKQELFDIEFDAVYEGWSRVDKLRLKTNGLYVDYLTPAPQPVEDILIQKHWKDTFGFSLGGDVNVLPDRLKLRGGVYYETAAADPAYANVDFPTGSQLGGSLGTALTFGSFQVAAAFELRKMQTVTVSESSGRVYQQKPLSACEAPYTDPATCFTLGQPSPTVNAGTYDFMLLGATLDVSYRF